MRGNEAILGTSGPLSTSLAGLKIFMKTVIDGVPSAFEPTPPPLPWTEWTEPFTSSRKLHIAVMWDDGIVTPHPPVRRALEETVKKLRQANNVQVTDWKPWKHDYAWDLCVGSISLYVSAISFRS